MRSRGIAAVLTIALMAAGTGGVLAGGGNGHSDGSSAKTQYRPGKGCGDKNHIHARHNECKKGHEGKKNGHDGGDEHGHGHGHD